LPKKKKNWVVRKQQTKSMGRKKRIGIQRKNRGVNNKNGGDRARNKIGGALKVRRGLISRNSTMEGGKRMFGGGRRFF